MSRMEGKRTTLGFGTPGVGMGSVLVLLVWAMGVPVSAQPAAVAGAPTGAWSGDSASLLPGGADARDPERRWPPGPTLLAQSRPLRRAR